MPSNFSLSPELLAEVLYQYSLLKRGEMPHFHSKKKKEKIFVTFLATINKSQTSMNATAKGGTLMKISYLKLLMDASINCLDNLPQVEEKNSLNPYEFIKKNFNIKEKSVNETNYNVLSSIINSLYKIKEIVEQEHNGDISLMNHDELMAARSNLIEQMKLEKAAQGDRAINYIGNKRILKAGRNSQESDFDDITDEIEDTETNPGIRHGDENKALKLALGITDKKKKKKPRNGKNTTAVQNNPIQLGEGPKAPITNSISGLQSDLSNVSKMIIKIGEQFTSGNFPSQTNTQNSSKVETTLEEKLNQVADLFTSGKIDNQMKKDLEDKIFSKHFELN